MGKIPTVAIVDPRFASGRRVINASEFDPEVHTRFDPATAPKTTAPPPPAPEPPASDTDPTANQAAAFDAAAMLKGTAAEVIAAVRDLSDVDQLAALLQTESETHARKTVVKEIEARQAELSEG